MIDDVPDTKARIVKAARDLLTTGGRDAVSTRAVSAAAGVQAPTIYRQFGDMRGLLDAVARDVLADYVRQKAILENSDDPVEDLRAGWRHHVAFGLANPAAYLLIYSDPETFADAPERREGEMILLKQVSRIAESGRLAVSVPHAARLISAAGRGVVLSLISTPVGERDSQLAHSMCEAILSVIVTERSTDETPRELSAVTRVAPRAIALRAVLADAPELLSPAEQLLLGEWLDRLAGARRPGSEG